MRLPHINKVKSCKHCWGTFSFYQKVFVSWWTFDHTLFNWEKMNTEMWDSMSDWKYNPTCYCWEFDKPIWTLPKDEQFNPLLQ